MNNLLITVLSLSVSGSIFIAILLLFKPLYAKRLSKRWQYYVWLIVIMRLLIPFSFEVNLTESIFYVIGQVNGSATHISSELYTTQIAAIDFQPVEIQTLAPETPSVLDMFISYAWLVWIVVALILFVRKLTVYQSFATYIKAGRVELNNIEDLERFGKLVAQSKIKKMVGIYTNSLISSPLLIGFFKPYIVLPTTDISESDFRHTIMHELTHYKRGDMFYKWLVQITICLHWFNPIVYVMGKEINNACEFSCDEAVIKRLDNSGIKEYGNTLLNALGFGGEYKNVLASITLSENKKILGERLNMIKNFKKKSKIAAVCAALVTMVLCLGVGVVGVYGVTVAPAPLEEPAEILLISEDFELDIPFIATGEEILLGRLNIEVGQSFEISANAEDGNGIFVGVRNVIVAQRPNPLTSMPLGIGAPGWHWMPWVSQGNTGSVYTTITLEDSRFVYVFVGSSSPISRDATDLTNVTVSLTMLDN